MNFYNLFFRLLTWVTVVLARFTFRNSFPSMYGMMFSSIPWGFHPFECAHSAQTKNKASGFPSALFSPYPYVFIASMVPSTDRFLY